MQAVARSASEEVLRQVDKLISEGQNPTHFARQLVRFLRNALVAKLRAKTLPCCRFPATSANGSHGRGPVQRRRSGAALQIMLRTLNELGYRQEQRFHLELGLLKMAHAQRLLPIEQLLSEAASAAGAVPPARPGNRPAIVPENRGTPAPPQARGNFVSPFAADSARKTKPEMSSEAAPATGPRIVGMLGRTRNPWDRRSRAGRGGAHLYGACSAKRTAQASLHRIGPFEPGFSSQRSTQCTGRRGTSHVGLNAGNR